MFEFFIDLLGDLFLVFSTSKIYAKTGLNSAIYWNIKRLYLITELLLLVEGISKGDKKVTIPIFSHFQNPQKVYKAGRNSF